MSIAWTPKQQPVPRGAAPVGFLADLPRIERRAVRFMRLWCSGPAGREAVVDAFSENQNPARAAQAVNAFGGLMRIIQQHPRRAIMYHSESCHCLGGDESAFAHMVASAVVDHDEAMAFALVLIQSNAAFQAVQIAENVGLSLLNLSRKPVQN